MSIFNKTQFPKIGGSTFNLSHNKKLSMNMGELVPMLVQECVPGDKFEISTQQMLRTMPLVAPLMHEVNVFTHFFFVPNRILFKDWEKFITGGEDGLATVILPYVKLAQAGHVPSGPLINYRLSDYLGLPVNPFDTYDKVPEINISILPHLAYQKIYNEYYRDQNLVPSMDPLFEDIIEGWNSEQAGGELFKLQKRAWQHDYFTSALPWAQKGNPVKLPLGNVAPIRYKEDYATAGAIVRNAQNDNPANQGIDLTTGPGGALAGNPLTGERYTLDNSAQLEADLSEATSATINDLRRAFSLQSWLEKNARAGSRYVESILSHFGVRSSDARLQRPEYIGGGMSPVMFSEVLQTSETQDTPQGNMAGKGLNLGNNGRVSKYCEEHGYIIGIMSVMPKTAYQQGIPRHYSKFDKFDYFWPDFEHIGEQAILNKEIFVNYDDTSLPDKVFGYIPRYSEYKYNPSTVSGYFKTSLDFWHMGRKFSPDYPPALNRDFIEANPTRRIFAVEDEQEDTLLVEIFHSIRAKRKMKYFSNPSRII